MTIEVQMIIAETNRCVLYECEYDGFTDISQDDSIHARNHFSSIAANELPITAHPLIDFTMINYNRKLVVIEIIENCTKKSYPSQLSILQRMGVKWVIYTC